MKKVDIYTLVILMFTFGAAKGWAEVDTIKIATPSKVAGEFFGEQVSMENYNFAKAAAAIFGGEFGNQPKTKQELEDRTWEDLLLSFEAHRRNVIVTQEELDLEVTNILQAEKVTFDWKKDKAAYEKWVNDKVKESYQMFENQLRHLLQLKKLRDQVRESLAPEVKEEEAYQKYLNEYNTLSVEFVQFDDLKSAQDYYQKMKDSKKWALEAKKNPKFSVKPGFVSLEFLIEMWKFPKDDAYAMLNLPIGSVYKPAPIYKGYAVFHILEKRVAEKDKFQPLKQQYFDKVKSRKQYEGLNAWIKQLKEDSHMKVYVNPTLR